MMISNLAKSPLMAIFFGALLYLAGAFIPYSESYVALSAEFTATMQGVLFLFAFALWISLAAAVAFGSANKGGVKTIALIAVALLGNAWLLPALEPILRGENPGVMAKNDALFSSGFYAVCTVLVMILFTLNYKTHSKPDNQKTAPATRVTYKLKPLDLAVKIIVLPLIYTVLFFVAWYFLHWRNDEIRAFYGGPPENLGFVNSVVRILLDMVWVLFLALAKGLGYTLFALPLLFLFPGKRIIYIALTIILYLSGAVWLLIPTPLMADSVRISNCIYTAALLTVFGALSAVLLHTSFKKEVIEIPQQRPQLTPRQAALARARGIAAAQQQAEDSAVKDAAAAVSTTLKG